MLDKMITNGNKAVLTIAPNKDLSLADARAIIKKHESESDSEISFDYSSSLICDAFYYGVAIGMKISNEIQE